MENNLQKVSGSDLQAVNRARTGVKIEYCKADDISKSILTCCALIGLDSKPTLLEAKVLMEYMIEFLKRYSLEEMELAFKTMAQNKTEKIEHYGKFSASFLQDVMDNYRLYRDKLTGEERRNQESVYTPGDKQDEKEMYDFIDGYCDREQRLPYAGPWTHAYNYMIDKGIINPSEEEKEKIKRIVSRKNTMEDEKDFQYCCKREYTIQYFEMKYGIIRPDIIL